MAFDKVLLMTTLEWVNHHDVWVKESVAAQGICFKSIMDPITIVGSRVVLNLSLRELQTFPL